MKQHISAEQFLKELTPEQQIKLSEWWIPKIGDTFIIEDGTEIHSIDKSWLLIVKGHDTRFSPLLSIGQCIELLDSNLDMNIEKELGQWTVFSSGYLFFNREELVDVLWESVKSMI